MVLRCAFVGRSQDDAQVEVDQLVSDGMTMIPPFDHPNIIAGQGTIGLELAEDLLDLTTALVQLSGGGLISGVAAALKACLPNIKMIGVSMERGAAMYQCQKARQADNRAGTSNFGRFSGGRHRLGKLLYLWHDPRSGG